MALVFSVHARDLLFPFRPSPRGYTLLFLKVCFHVAKRPDDDLGPLPELRTWHVGKEHFDGFVHA